MRVTLQLGEQMTNDAKAILIVLLLIVFMLALILSGCGSPVIADRCEYQLIPKYEERDMPRIIVEEDELPADPQPEPEPQAEPVRGAVICQL